MCTGNFQETDTYNLIGNLRPHPGTKCASECKIESGRWGKSWCWTDIQETQWGAECVECSG